MTAQRFMRRNHGNSHSYSLDGEKVPGVTTIIGILDKPALVGWAAKETAAYADEHWAELSELRSADRLERLTKARFQTNKRATVRGHRVHAFGERIAKGEQIEKSEIDPHLLPWVESYARFLDEWDMEILHTEMPVANTSYRYGGTLDAIAYTPRIGRVLLDLKTGKGVYPETALQLAGYRYCDLALEEEVIVGPRGGKRTNWRETTMPEVDDTWVAHLREDSVEFRPVKADEETYDVFLHLSEIHDAWLRRIDWDNRHKADAIQAIGAPEYPEDRPLIEEGPEA